MVARAQIPFRHAAGALRLPVAADPRHARPAPHAGRELAPEPALAEL